MNSTQQTWHQALLSEASTIFDAICNLDKVAIKIVLVIDDEGKLVGTVSDGDIRRGLLRGLDMVSPIAKVVQRNPFVVTPEISRETTIKLMMVNKIQQIPVVDEQRKIVGLHLWDQIITPLVRSNIMVIMAGGKGTRLRPLTDNCPKPMLQVGGKPMLEHIINRAKANGFNHFKLAINYLGHMVEEYFGDGSPLNTRIDYIKESESLGTAGAISLMAPRPKEPFLVTNGDVLTDINYGELLDFHIRNQAVATMAIRNHEWSNPYGVVEIKGMEIVGFHEKPIIRSHINAGVYALSPEVLNFIHPNEVCDMPTLFERIKSKNHRTIAYPMHEPWLDVGRPADYKNAQIKGGEK